MGFQDSPCPKFPMPGIGKGFQDSPCPTFPMPGIGNGISFFFAPEIRKCSSGVKLAAPEIGKDASDANFSAPDIRKTFACPTFPIPGFEKRASDSDYFVPDIRKYSSTAWDCRFLPAAFSRRPTSGSQKAEKGSGDA